VSIFKHKVELYFPGGEVAHPPEIGIGAAPNPAMIPGFTYNITTWKNGALTSLKESKCSKFFGGKGAKTINSTRYVPVGAAPEVFAYTSPGSNFVFINTLSSVFQALPGARFFGELRIGGVTATEAGIYGVLHELSHELDQITGAVSSDGGPSLAALGFNYYNSLRVMNACPSQ
jgi:hypothetical protein